MEDERVDVAIVGAGFAGLGAALRLREAGFRILVLEADEGLGGTWRANRYPGCACDIPSHLYSLSFEPKPDWSHLYGRQPEILAYLEEVAERRGVREHIRLATLVHEARWEEDTATWHLDTSAGSVRARHLVLGTGPLRIPRFPKLLGQENFQGPMMHTARFDPEVELSGQRVAVIGTGASAVQVVPALAERVRSLTVYQRSPPWILPRGDRALSPGERARFRRWPLLAKLRRTLLFWRQEMLGLAFFGWSKLGARARQRALANLAQGVPDADLREKLTPSYAPGCKRVLLSDDYYPTLAREDVELVAKGASSFTEDGVRDADGVERAADVVIFGTGFDLDTLLAPLEVYGTGGKSLSEAWAGAPRGHLGITVP
ncbi:MAG: NAD(P)/FAD-dependent oxidoreductase [Myxococcota bacterium]